MKYLEEAIELEKAATDTTSEENAIDRAARLNSLGALLHDKYLRTANKATLGEAIRIAQTAIKQIPRDYPNQTGFLSNLGN